MSLKNRIDINKKKNSFENIETKSNMQHYFFTTQEGVDNKLMMLSSDK